MSRSGCNSCFYCTSCEESPKCPCNRITSINDANRLYSVGVILSIVCVLFLFFGLCLPPLLNHALTNALHATQILAQDSDPAYDNFSSTSEYPIRVSVYMMDLQNPYDVVTNGAKPSFKEIGPFVYDMYRYAFNVTRNSFHTDITYKYQYQFMFIEDSSISADTETTICTANVPFWGVSYSTTQSPDSKGVIPVAIDYIPSLKETVDQVFTNKTVNEILYGYDDPLLAYLHNFMPTISPRFAGIIQNDTDIDAAYARAKSTTIGTGNPNYNKLRQMYAFEEMSHMEYQGKEPWGLSALNDVHGSDGAAFPVPFNTTETLDHFATTLYRNVSLEFSEQRVHKDIDVYRYKFPTSIWKNSEEIPFNSYYNQNGYSGLVNLTSCVNAGIFLSLPRFQLADEANKLIETDWDTKEQTDFTTYFDLEPKTGSALNVYLSSQLNIHMYPQNYTIPDPDDEFETIEVTYYENLTDHFFPVFWSEQTAGINDEDASLLASVIHAVETAGDYASIVSLSFALFFGIISFWILTRANLYFKNFSTASQSDLYPTSGDDELPPTHISPNGLESISLDSGHHKNNLQRARYGSTESTPTLTSKPHNVKYSALSDETLTTYEEIPQDNPQTEYRASVLIAKPNNF